MPSITTNARRDVQDAGAALKFIMSNLDGRLRMVQQHWQAFRQDLPTVHRWFCRLRARMHDKEVKLKSSCAGSVSELHPITVDVLLSAPNHGLQEPFGPMALDEVAKPFGRTTTLEQ